MFTACFTGIFILEMLFKWIAVGIPTYFRAENWNIFDFCIVVGAAGCCLALPSLVLQLCMVRVLR
jgi:hypothetical protein